LDDDPMIMLGECSGSGRHVSLCRCRTFVAQSGGVALWWQVRTMLIKTKATGRTSLHADDRYYLEVRFGGLGGEGEGGTAEVVDYVFVSRLWTAGRTLDEVVGKHALALQRAYPGIGAGAGEGGARYMLVSAVTGRCLPLGAVLSELPPEELRPCDAVVILPFSPPPPDGPTSPAQPGLEASSVSGGGGEAAGKEEGRDPLPLPSEALGADAVVGASAPAVSITVQRGKDAFVVGFSAEEWEGGTVLDLKTRVEAMAGVPRAKQKLVAKSVLADADRLAGGKLKNGAKVMLMTQGRT
jgi:hypothetical protein